MILVEFLLEEPVLCAVLITLLVWLIFAGLLGNILPIVCGVLISVFIHWRFSQRLVTLGLSRRNSSREKGNVALSLAQDRNDPYVKSDLKLDANLTEPDVKLD